MTEKTLIIVGAGVAGASTALAALGVYTKVSLIDDPSPPFVPASQGLGRIVRASYPEDKTYENLALEGLEEIQSGPLSNYFHPSLRHVLEPGGTGSQRKTFREIKFRDLVGTYDNQPAGRIDAADALECIKRMALVGGVVFRREKVISIVWDGDSCRGVRTNEGSIYYATSVLLAMGYRVPEFLASQGKPMDDGLCQIALVPWGEVQLDQQHKKLQGEVITIVPGVGEYLQGTENNMLVNNARTVKVTNLEQVEREYPLQEHSWYYKETHDLVGWLLPHLKDAPFKLHYCLDLITANQHFLIRPVSNCRGLYMACGFSFHGFKFISVIGKYVVEMMEGNLDPKLLNLWSGTLDGNEVHAEVMPRRQFGEGEDIALNQD